MLVRKECDEMQTLGVAHVLAMLEGSGGIPVRQPFIFCTFSCKVLTLFCFQDNSTGDQFLQVSMPPLP